MEYKNEVLSGEIMEDRYFVEEVKKYNITDPLEILNWYRNLYYKENGNTERGIMAIAINDLFMLYKTYFDIEKSEIDEGSLRFNKEGFRIFNPSEPQKPYKPMRIVFKGELKNE